ncbi:hypothetical protein FOZ62_016594, partial [Perkinsus olseni]
IIIIIIIIIVIFVVLVVACMIEVSLLMAGEFCISSSGKLPGGPCCPTCIFCVYAYRDRTISSDEESGGEELGLYDADAHAAVLPKYRPDNDRMNRVAVVAKKRRRNHKKETEAERSSMGCNPTHVSSIDTTKKAIIPVGVVMMIGGS